MFYDDAARRSSTITRNDNDVVYTYRSAEIAAMVTVIAYAEFENVIEIDRNRNVLFDFEARIRKR